MKRSRELGDDAVLARLGAKLGACMYRLQMCGARRKEAIKAGAVPALCSILGTGDDKPISIEVLKALYTIIAPDVSGVPYCVIFAHMYVILQTFGSHPRLIGLLGAPVRGPTSNEEFGHHVLLVTRHLYQNVLKFLLSVKYLATRIRRCLGTHAGISLLQ